MAVKVVESPANEKPVYTLDATHRCDRCGAQAYVRVFLKSENSLLFCGHHFADLESVLSSIWNYTVDERERLVENKLQGSEK
jgi:hypothetical protein